MAGDFDQDGVSDLAEFKADTIPGLDTSVLRVVAVTSVVGGGRRWDHGVLAGGARENVPGAIQG
jgi:hypothetical protein